MRFEHFAELKNLLALEYGCREGDFDKSENILTTPVFGAGRNYSDDRYFFSMVTLGKNCVAAADERLHPFLRGFIDSRPGHWLFELPNLMPLEAELNLFGYKLNMLSHFYLPKYEVDIKSNIPVKWFNGRAEIEPFYEGGRFPNALCKRFLENRPDRIAVCAYDDSGGIMGMAGCSEDAPRFLQIGVDVFPKYRGKGIGAYLVLLIKNEIIRRGEIPYYGTASANIHSQNIALNCGFRPAWTEISCKKLPARLPEDKTELSGENTWVDDMKQELEDYIEEQGIYIRQ